MTPPVRKSSRAPKTRVIEEAVPLAELIKPKIKRRPRDLLAKLKEELTMKNQKIKSMRSDAIILKVKLEQCQESEKESKSKLTALKDENYGKRKEYLRVKKELRSSVFQNYQLNLSLSRDLEGVSTNPFDCQKCKQSYLSNVASRVPRVLHCGHTFCHGCVETLREESQEYQVEPNGIRCPYDKKDMKCEDVSSLTINFAAIQ